MQDIRRTILDEISHIKATDDTEVQHINDALSWVESGADLFRIQKPDIPPKHLVSYFVLIDPKQHKLLLVDHILAQLWLPTGGHVEVDEHPRHTVVREAMEELGRPAVFLHDQKPFFITVTDTVGLTAGHTDVSLWYLLQGSEMDFIDFDTTEFHDTEWFSFDEILASDPIIFDPHMHRFTRKLIAHFKPA